jgi:hypothetical protein
MRLRVDQGFLEALAFFWDPTHCCFSIGEMDLVPTLEEYAELLQLSSSFNEKPFMPTPGPRSNRVLEKFLGLTSEVLSLGDSSSRRDLAEGQHFSGLSDEVLLLE